MLLLYRGFKFFFKKKLFTKKSVEQSQNKKLISFKLNHKTVRLHCYCGDNVTYGFILKRLVSMKATICRLRKCQSNDKLLK